MNDEVPLIEVEWDHRTPTEEMLRRRLTRRVDGGRDASGIDANRAAMAGEEWGWISTP